jgi:hypothetical protein
MSKQMRALPARLHSSFCQSSLHHARNRSTTVETNNGSITADKQVPTAALRAIMPQVMRDRSCHIRWQRQLCALPAFTAHGNPGIFPIDVFKVELDNFARSEAQAREQEQDGVVASP